MFSGIIENCNLTVQKIRKWSFPKVSIINVLECIKSEILAIELWNNFVYNTNL